MSRFFADPSAIELKGNLTPYYHRIAFLITTATLLSGSIIVYFNNVVFTDEVMALYTSMEVAAITILPYMISAVVAAMTAIGVMSMMPILRSRGPARKIQIRIERLGAGDLTVSGKLDCSNEYLKDIATELNYSIGLLNHRVAQLKIINRQQWDLLEGVRQAARRNDSDSALSYVEKIEKNWHRIADVEDQFLT